jgi:RecB family endonuclease NucS
MYAARLAEFRPQERLLKTENGFAESRVRADMRTVDSRNCLYIWEFKIAASYDGLGQILTYVALERQASRFQRSVQGVLAAFSIQSEIRTAIDVLNLGIELVELPLKLRLAGGIPFVASSTPVPNIPVLAGLVPMQGDSR